MLGCFRQVRAVFFGLKSAAPGLAFSAGYGRDNASTEVFSLPADIRYTHELLTK